VRRGAERLDGTGGEVNGRTHSCDRERPSVREGERKGRGSFPQQRLREKENGKGTGSGVVAREEGYILGQVP